MLRGCGKSGDVTNTSPDLRRVALGALLTAAPGDGKANGTCRSRPASPKCSAFPCVRYASAAPTSRTEQPPAREAGSNCGTPGRRRLAGGEPETESSEEREDGGQPLGPPPHSRRNRRRDAPPRKRHGRRRPPRGHAVAPAGGDEGAPSSSRRDRHAPDRRRADGDDEPLQGPTKDLRRRPS
jgi:hypothetical protein